MRPSSTTRAWSGRLSWGVGSVPPTIRVRIGCWPRIALGREVALPPQAVFRVRLQSEELGDPEDDEAGQDRVRDGEAQSHRAHGGQITEDLPLVGEADDEPGDEAPDETAQPGRSPPAGGVAEDGARATGAEGCDHAGQRHRPAEP